MNNTEGNNIQCLYHAWMTQLGEQLPSGVPAGLQERAREAVAAHLDAEVIQRRASYDAAASAVREFRQQIAK